MDEVDLNASLNWYIADAMDEYIGHVDSGAAKKMIGRNRAYSKLLQAVKDAAIMWRQTAIKIARRRCADKSPIWNT
jgi:bacillopeptidase F (M6 metalloprotease family)